MRKTGRERKRNRERKFIVKIKKMRKLNPNGQLEKDIAWQQRNFPALASIASYKMF